MEGYWRDEALECQGKIRGYEVSQDQVLGESCHADINSQVTYIEPDMYSISTSLCHTAALNA